MAKPKVNRQELDHRWAEEAERRIDAYDRGEIEAFSVSEVFAALRNRPSSLTEPSRGCKFKSTAK